MCYTQRKIEGRVSALREPDDTKFLKPNGQSRILNIYGYTFTGHIVTIPFHISILFQAHFYSFYNLFISNQSSLLLLFYR